jgi:uracil-DNA glycosylase
VSHKSKSEDKNVGYSELVEKRKKCRLCKHLGLTNPSEFEYDTEQIGPWTHWQGNLDAQLMVVGQDWGGKEVYNEQEGLDIADNTNSKLRILLDSVGVKISLPLGAVQPKNTVSPLPLAFFTNSVLCLRERRNSTGIVSPCCYANCATEFLRPQVDLVKPKVVVSLGLSAFKSLVKVFRCDQTGKAAGGEEQQEETRRLMRLKMLGAVDEAHVALTKCIWLVPVFHPASANRPTGTGRAMEQQTNDWKRVREALVEWDALAPC